MPKSYYTPHFVKYVVLLVLFIVPIDIIYLIILRMRQKQKSKWKAFLESSKEVSLELLVYAIPLIYLGIVGLLAFATWETFNK